MYDKINIFITIHSKSKTAYSHFYLGHLSACQYVTYRYTQRRKTLGTYVKVITANI